MMIHEPFGLAQGPAADMRQMADTLDKMGRTIAEIYVDRAGGTVDDWRRAMEAETWHRAVEAVDAGLADEVQHYRPKARATRILNLAQFRNVPEWVSLPKSSSAVGAAVRQAVRRALSF